MNICDWSVYVVTDSRFSNGRSTLDILEQAAAGSVSAVQLREKDLSGRLFYEEALSVRDFLKARHIPFIVNDRVDIALAVGADGVHLGQTDIPVAAARRMLGPGKILGISVSSLEHIQATDTRIVDYLGVGSIFPTTTKIKEVAPWGLEGLKRARQATTAPIVAIGGIKIEHVEDVIAAGADCIAVVTAIVGAESPARAAMEFALRITAAKERRQVGR